MSHVRSVASAVIWVASLSLIAALTPPAPVPAADPLPPWLYVLRSESSGASNETPVAPELLVINPATQHVIVRITLPTQVPIPLDREGDLAIAPDARRAYVATTAGLVVVDLVANAVVGLLDIGGSARRLALLPDGSRLFVTRRDNSGVVIVDTATGTMTGALSITSARELALSSDGSRLYVLGTGLVSEFNSASGAFLREIAISGTPQQLLVHSPTNRFYLTLDGIRESVVAHDLTTGAVTGSLELPNLYFNNPGISGASGFVGRAVVMPDGLRLIVPHYSQGFATPLNQTIHGEYMRVIATASLTIEGTVTPPREIPFTRLGIPGLSVWREGSTVFGVGPRSSFSLDPVGQTATLVGPHLLGGVQALQAVSPHPCAVEIWPQQLYTREPGGAMTITVPAPAGCAWTATSSDAWLGITSPATGTGPGTVTLAAQATDAPRTATVTIAGQRVLVTQLDSEIEILTPAPHHAVGQPITVSGWVVDRPSTDRGSASTGTNSGIEVIIISATPAAGGATVVLNQVSTNSSSSGVYNAAVHNAAVEATYGYRYRNAGFSIPISRLAPGNYILTVQGRSKWDGTLITATRPVTVVRQPLVALGGQPTAILQPYKLQGWAADLTAATGTGVDAIEVTAQRAGEAPVVLPGAVYGLHHGFAASVAGVSSPFNAGFEVWIRNLAPGAYTVTVRARSIATGQFDAQDSRQVTIQSMPPEGIFDTPATGVTNIEGTIAVTGWAIDDYRVDRVEIWRACVESVDRPRGICRSVTPADPADDVFVGLATFLPGARPDVRVLFPNHHNADRTGWGYLLLTNALPHIPNGLPEGGQGTFTLKAYAVDGEGLYTRLGTKVIGLSNDAATRPFGSIDTPEQGAAIPGPAFPFNEPHAYPVFGWAVTQAGKCIDTSSAASYRVYVDGVARTLTPGVNWFAGMNRADIAAAYPGLCNSNSAVAAYYLDTRTLTNGLHTIGWDVTDSAGRTAGIGSRFFAVLNTGGEAGAEAPASAGTDAPRRQMEADALASALVRTGARALRAAIGQAETSVWVRADPDGVYRVQLPQTGRLAIDLDGAVERGYERRESDVETLPAGSTLQPAEGRFYWQPPVGFLGTFPLVFVTGGERIELVVTIVDPPPASAEAEVTITSPRAGANPNPVITVTGTARDPRALSATGISAVHVWARRMDLEVATSRGSEAQFLGAAELSGDGYRLTSTPLAPGTYQIEVYAWVARTGTWAPAATVTIAVR